MGYCCGQITGDSSLITSKTLTCIATGASYQLTVPVSNTAVDVEIIWFFKAAGATIFTEYTALQNQQSVTLTENGQYKVIVQNANSSVFVSGSVPCQTTYTEPVIVTTNMDKHYSHHQAVSSAQWIIQHNLAKFPNIVTIDSSGNEIVGYIQYLSINISIVTFSSPFTGDAYCN